MLLALLGTSPASAGPDPPTAAHRLHLGEILPADFPPSPVWGLAGSALVNAGRPPTWTVYAGAEALSPPEFAARVGDTETLRRIRTTRAWSIPTYVGLLAAGPACSVVSLALLTESNDPRVPLAVLGAGVGATLLAMVPGVAWERTTRMHRVYERQQAQVWVERYHSAPGP